MATKIILQFEIPIVKAQRIDDSLPFYGYVFDPNLGTTNRQQKEEFVRRRTIDMWNADLFNYERSVAIAAEPNDSAALQAKRYDGLSDVTSQTTSD